MCRDSLKVAVADSHEQVQRVRSSSDAAGRPVGITVGDVASTSADQPRLLSSCPHGCWRLAPLRHGPGRVPNALWCARCTKLLARASTEERDVGGAHRCVRPTTSTPGDSGHACRGQVLRSDTTTSDGEGASMDRETPTSGGSLSPEAESPPFTTVRDGKSRGRGRFPLRSHRRSRR